MQRGAPLRATLALFAADQAEGWAAGACLLGLIAALGGPVTDECLPSRQTCSIGKEVDGAVAATGAGCEPRL